MSVEAVNVSSQQPAVAYRSQYTAGSRWGCLPLQSVYNLSSVERARMRELGVLATSVLKTASEVVTDAIKTGKPDWLCRIMLASFSPEPNDRQLLLAALDQSRGMVPRMFRLDVLSDGTIAEIQVPGSGWGHSSVFEQMHGLDNSDCSVVDFFRRRLQGQLGTWWLYNPAFEQAVRSMAELCDQYGVAIQGLLTSDFDPTSLDLEVVIKRPPLPELLRDDDSDPQGKGRVLLRSWLDGRVEMDPPPHVVPEVKHVMAMLHHPDTRGFFTEAERNICHPTVLLTDSRVTVCRLDSSGAVVSTTIPELVGQRQPVVVKYGGARKWDRFGGHAVHSFTHKRLKPHDRQQIIDQAVAEYQQSGEGWIAQPFVEQRRTLASLGQPEVGQLADFWRQEGCEERQAAEFLKAERRKGYYCLYRPGYFVDESGATHLGPVILNLRTSWKVHGSSDSAFGLAK